jgi:hypothetical protein
VTKKTHTLKPERDKDGTIKDGEVTRLAKAVVDGVRAKHAHKKGKKPH